MHNRNSKIYCDCKKVANDKRPLTSFFFYINWFCLSLKLEPVYFACGIFAYFTSSKEIEFMVENKNSLSVVGFFRGSGVDY